MHEAQGPKTLRRLLPFFPFSVLTFRIRISHPSPMGHSDPHAAAPAKPNPNEPITVITDH